LVTLISMSLQQRGRLHGMVFEKAPVGRQVGHCVHLHAALEPPQHGRTLVVGEVVPGALAQQRLDRE